MHYRFFPKYSEQVLQDMNYSIQARNKVFMPDSTDAREFIYYAECVERDVAEEKKQRDMLNGRLRAAQSRR